MLLFLNLIRHLKSDHFLHLFLIHFVSSHLNIQLEAFERPRNYSSGPEHLAVLLPLPILLLLLGIFGPEREENLEFFVMVVVGDAGKEGLVPVLFLFDIICLLV